MAQLHSTTDARPQAQATRRRRARGPPPAPTNSLILCLPPSRVLDPLLHLLHAHFASAYGTLHAWTPLVSFGRVVAVYATEDEAARAKGEMDGFVWEDEHERTVEHPQPLRVYFGPTFPLDRLAYLPRTAGHPPPASSLLEVPASGKNFLISPPGSPPVGWEQIEEDAPNRRTFHDGDASDDEVDFDELKKAGGGDDGRWADELSKALRFLSVQGGGDSDDDELEGDDVGQEGDDEVMADSDSGRQPRAPSTHVVLAPAPIPPSSSNFTRGGPDSPTLLRPAVTVSSPPTAPRRDSSSSPPPTATPPPGATKITSVKATFESMLGNKGGAHFAPTARPPVA
ncbi:uncharacterized protein RHOBADRAFT_52730 [Rhodotorula graminis WP1]|uniref:Calcipressin n=1 Tax=Rhodotorula graminis (strain WP1) TaxID=578459 RepID=A0A194S5A6_RHOGW|nr:uncharacterized protein RHOBADRAFT_52730 [Rhodotorula graminis WP1]KPV75695.1 hypothetical protein RHOBADRAFT_52730 [Rhodotorula graminis WP1]